MNDRRIVAAQIGREPRSAIDVAAQCHLGLPVVIKVPPHLDDGTPFPTTYWLTCPLASKRVGRLEAAGGVKAAEDRIAADSVFADRHRAAAERYRRDRDAMLGPEAPAYLPDGGVGGTRRGVKCLHAHYADHAAGNENPVGENAAIDVEPLDCATVCVVQEDDLAFRNPNWREPRL